MMNQKRDREKDKEALKELERKIELIELDKSNLENDLKSKEQEIEDVKKQLQEELSRPKRSVASMTSEEYQQRIFEQFVYFFSHVSFLPEFVCRFRPVLQAVQALHAAPHVRCP